MDAVDKAVELYFQGLSLIDAINQAGINTDSFTRLLIKSEAISLTEEPIKESYGWKYRQLKIVM
ncbi:hypothetical protein IAI10_13210 [Clostridium sp. 19966]|uniref:hypothetical protein n=1 Tax=Clostridium sp. 19966 TaxID=2768166 RepID=UPI0028DF04BE|nr:hypothetical protein [Clostridium sp. 19966]MDT8717625.1 hypothetical protein [Clostridium sp. 19966]